VVSEDSRDIADSLIYVARPVEVRSTAELPVRRCEQLAMAIA
jgi:hypothetical protein